MPNRAQSCPIVLFVVIRALYRLVTPSISTADRGTRRHGPPWKRCPRAGLHGPSVSTRSFTDNSPPSAFEPGARPPPLEQVNTSNTLFLPIRRTAPAGAVRICWPSTFDPRRSTPLILAFDARRSTFDRPYWHFTHAPRRLLAFDVRPSAFDSPDRRSTPLVAICRSPSDRAPSHRKHRHL